MRAFRLLATPALLIGLLIFLIWEASLGWNALTAPFPSPPPTPYVAQQTNRLVPEQVTVLVYNGDFTSGLGSKVGQALKAAGFEVAKTTGSKGCITKTIIHNGGNSTGAAELVASYFIRSAMETDSRVDGTVGVMVGSDFAGLVESGLTEITVESDTICLAPSPSPSALPS